MVTNLTKNISTVYGYNKIGGGWRYEEPDLLYEMAELYYENYGSVISITNLSKNTATIKNLVKT